MRVLRYSCGCHPSGVSTTSNPGPGDAVILNLSQWGHTGIIMYAYRSSAHVLVTVLTPLRSVGSGSINAVLTTTVNGTSKTWTPTLNDTTSKYFYVRVVRGGVRMAWTAPIWTGR